MSYAALVDPPEEIDPTPWWLIEHLAITGLGDPVVLNTRSAPKISNPMDGDGGWSLEINNSEAEPFLLTHRVVRFSILDIINSNETDTLVYRPYYVGLADKPDEHIIGGTTTQLVGRGAIALLSYVPIRPNPRSLGGLPVDSRWWNFSHLSIDTSESPWTRTVYRSIQGDQTALPPLGLAGLPWSFCNPLAFWISSREPDGADPIGVEYHDFTYELEPRAGEDPDTLQELIWEATGDDGISIWVNESPLGDVWDPPAGDAASDSHRARGLWRPGTLHVRVAVGNFERPANIENNCSLFVLACSRAYVDEDGIETEEFLFTTSNGYDSPGVDEWRSLDGTVHDAPGPHIGEVIWDVIEDEVGDDTEIGLFGFSFGRTIDSGGLEFERIPWFRIDIGLSLFDLLEHLRDEGWIEFDWDVAPDGRLVLGVWTPGTAGFHFEGVQLGAGNLDGTGNINDGSISVDHSSVFTGLIARYAFGFVQVGSGPKWRSIKLGDDVLDEAEATRQAAAILAQFNTVQPSIVVRGDWGTQIAGPVFGGFEKRDWINADLGSGPDEWRIVQVGIDTDRETGRPVWILELNSRREEIEARLLRMAKRVDSGGLGGRTTTGFAPAARQQPMTRVEMVTIDWTAPGEPSQEEREAAVGDFGYIEYFSPALPAPAGTIRLTRIKITGNPSDLDFTFLGPDPGELDSSVDIIKAFADVYIDTGLGDGETVYWKTVSAVVPAGTDLICAVKFGRHKDIGVMLYGSPMGRQPSEPRTPR